jgi:hypothetical protein
LAGTHQHVVHSCDHLSALRVPDLDDQAQVLLNADVGGLVDEQRDLLVNVGAKDVRDEICALGAAEVPSLGNLAVHEGVLDDGREMFQKEDGHAALGSRCAQQHRKDQLGGQLLQGEAYRVSIYNKNIPTTMLFIV